MKKDLRSVDQNGPGTKARIQKTEGKKGRPKYVIDKETLSQVFHLPFEKACEQLGIGSTTLKRICREQQIGRWPYRRLMCADNMQRRKGNGNKLLSEVSQQVLGASRSKRPNGRRNGKVSQNVANGYFKIAQALSSEISKADEKNFSVGNSSAGVNQSVKKNKSFHQYMNTVLNLEPVGLSSQKSEPSSVSMLLHEDPRLGGGDGSQESSIGRRRRGVKKSRSFLLQFSEDSAEVTPLMTYDLPIDLFENTEDLLKIFENPNTQSQMTAQNSQMQLLAQNGISKSLNSDQTQQNLHAQAAAQQLLNDAQGQRSILGGAPLNGNSNKYQLNYLMTAQQNMEDLFKCVD